MFSSDVPIMTAPMIWSVAWDVTRGGWLGPTMVLWCYWRLGGTAYLVWLLCCFDVIYVHCDVAFVHCDVYFSIFFTVLVRRIDVPLSFLLVHSSVYSSIYVDPVLPGVEFSLLFVMFPCTRMHSLKWERFFSYRVWRILVWDFTLSCECLHFLM